MCVFFVLFSELVQAIENQIANRSEIYPKHDPDKHIAYYYEMLVKYLLIRTKSVVTSWNRKGQKTTTAPIVKKLSNIRMKQKISLAKRFLCLVFCCFHLPFVPIFAMANWERHKFYSLLERRQLCPKWDCYATQVDMLNTTAKGVEIVEISKNDGILCAYS